MTAGGVSGDDHKADTPRPSKNNGSSQESINKLTQSCPNNGQRKEHQVKVKVYDVSRHSSMTEPSNVDMPSSGTSKNSASKADYLMKSYLLHVIPVVLSLRLMTSKSGYSSFLCS
jgi:hypothetical protein